MSVVSNACTDLTLVLIGRPRCQGGPGLRVGSPEVGAGSLVLTDRGRFRRRTSASVGRGPRAMAFTRHRAPPRLCFCVACCV